MNPSKSAHRAVWQWLRCVCLAVTLLAPLHASSADTIRIGVLGLRSPEQNRAQWEPLAAALNAALPGRHFVVETLSQPALEAAVANRELDFTLTQPAQYILLSRKYGLSAPLATQAVDLDGQRITAHGGVIFTRADQTGINSLADIKGRTVATLDRDSLGSYQMQAYELLEANVRLPQDVRLSVLGPPIDKTVDEVLAGRAEVGFVRSGLLERMAAEGKLDLAQIRIVHRQKLTDYPAAVSTRLYPEWAFSALPHVSEDLARDVTAKLFELQESNAATRAMGVRGFSVPADYTPVIDLMKDLRLPPFEAAPHFTLNDVWTRYRLQLIGTWVVAGSFLLLGLYLLLTRRRLMAKTRLVMQQKRQLEESEQRFRALFEDTRQAITLIEDGRFVAANAAALEMLRIDSLDQLIGRTPVDFSPALQPDGRRSDEKARDMAREAKARGAIHFEWEHRRADGEAFTAAVLATAIRQGDKSLLHVAWSDITTQKSTERELAEYRHELERRVAERTTELAQLTETLRSVNAEQQAIFDAAPVGMSYVKDNRITIVNRCFSELFGYAQDEIPTLEHWWQRAYPDPAYRQWVQETWAAAIARAEQTDGRIDSLEYRVTRKSGDPVSVLIGGQCVGDGLITSFTDISLLKDAQKAQRQAREAAEAASQAKADFLANMSHEIRTPMNAIIGMAHLALKADPTAPQRDYLQKIQASGRLLLGIINDILDFSKIEAGKLAIEHIDFELEKVVDTVVAQIAERAASKGLELIVSIDDAVPARLIGDPLRIGQVLINYTNNAVKFTDKGEISIRVGLEPGQPDTPRLRFDVEDTGIGIDEAHRQRLFRSFEQADSTTTRKYGGTGLGLAISKRLVELMGGEVGIDSTPGVGSTFWFSIPLQRGEATPARLLPTPDLRGRRILLIDDNDHAREVIGDMLRNMRFEVSCVASGAAGLAALTRAAEAGTPHDLVLLDWKMPDMDGIHTARAIQLLTLPKLPLLLMITAYDRDALTPAAREVGVSEVLIKPVGPSAVFNAVMHAFGVQAANASAPAAGATAPPHQDFSLLAGARALLVEDNELNQEVATAFLHDAGLRVDLAENGEIAVQKVRDGDYDVVLMDMQMPVMDGLAATREIRRMPERHALPIIAMTANAMAGDRERCIEAGMDDHIAKPIDPEALGAKLRQWVKPRRELLRSIPDSTGAALHSAAALAGLPGLDVELGLRYLSGREALYLLILGKFVSSQADAPARIAAARATLDWADAERIAHTLKGSAAQIGAVAVSAEAERLEQAIRNRAPADALDALQSTLDGSLSALVAAISGRLPRS